MFPINDNDLPGIWLLCIIPSEEVPNGFKRTVEDNVFVSPQNYELMRPFNAKGIIIALGILTELDPVVENNEKDQV